MERTIPELLAEQGFVIVPDVLGDKDVQLLLENLQSLAEIDASPGIRDLARKSAAVRALAVSPQVRRLVEPILGPRAAVVRSIFFNKSVETNWQVAWHQDLTIAVKAQVPAEGFGPWSVKENIAHVQAPVSLLEKMLTVRLHLDDADETNGALWAVPGSHKLGRLPPHGVASVAEAHKKHLCAANAGGAMLFRPLILHASRKATLNRPRRVVHLEFAADALPSPLEWWEYIIR